MRITLHPSKPLIWWYNRRDSIDMSPAYQRRGRLWSASDKAYLIDSIINGFDVPKLYVADFQLGESNLNNKKLAYAIIDGKQRLEAIFDFFDGNLVLNQDFRLRHDRSLKLGGLSLKDLKARHSQVAEMFETETVDIMSVVTDDERDINELFVRLNRSKPLTGAEIRNAMSGVVPDVIRTIAGHSFFSENIKFGIERAGDYNTAAKFLIFEYMEKIVGTKKNDLDAFARNHSVIESKIQLSARRVVDVLDIMQEIFLPKDSLLASAGPVPIYYWLIRQTPSESHVVLREFLLLFEMERQRRREDRMHRVTSEVRDATFARYDALNRSTNDVGSHVGRFEILFEEFEQWRLSPEHDTVRQFIMKK